jgi:hypothetical protein
MFTRSTRCWCKAVSYRTAGNASARLCLSLVYRLKQKVTPVHRSACAVPLEAAPGSRQAYRRVNLTSSTPASR